MIFANVKARPNSVVGSDRRIIRWFIEQKKRIERFFEKKMNNQYWTRFLDSSLTNL